VSDIVFAAEDSPHRYLGAIVELPKRPRITDEDMRAARQAEPYGTFPKAPHEPDCGCVRCQYPEAVSTENAAPDFAQRLANLEQAVARILTMLESR
jgi:hypothetical protein